MELFLCQHLSTPIYYNVVYPARIYRIYCNIVTKQAHIKIAMSN